MRLYVGAGCLSALAVSVQRGTQPEKPVKPAATATTAQYILVLKAIGAICKLFLAVEFAVVKKKKCSHYSWKQESDKINFSTVNKENNPG